ncbi:unnamed protein product [Phytophthora fragariaefolia]|uniref:Unnamed protein product n=1 Tax=Phytophthora fragariaefolia TaxID=1490495 RepID=A0A9W6Y687_9STRA|nr:unnamed protein product [Phytophthora fragariaefolia]
MHAYTMEVAIQIALQVEYSRQQARTPVTARQGNSAPGSAQGGSPGNGTTSGPVPMELGLAEQRAICWFNCGRLAHMKRVCPAKGQQKPPFGKSSGSKVSCSSLDQEPGKCRTPVGAERPTGGDLSLRGGRVEGTRHGGLAPESLGTLESRKSSDRLLVLHGRVRGYGSPPES